MPDAQRIGMVPNEVTAIKIAVAVLTPVYGEAHIKKEEPFHGKLDNGVWNVYGSVQQAVWPIRIFRVRRGGEPHVEISQEDGKILRIYHTK